MGHRTKLQLLLGISSFVARWLLVAGWWACCVGGGVDGVSKHGPKAIVSMLAPSLQGAEPSQAAPHIHQGP